MAKVTISLDEEHLAKWQEEAKKRDKNMSQFVRHCVESYLLLMEKVRQGKAK